ncbi:zinc ribbon domain-containing protein [Geobacter sulfurreducens]|uniref:FmdB family zinc ribbon protein n=1 Tax=Geobacter sulfurreducens TaxID=35554 RepID=UPI001BDC0C56|nr:zinc ribbon domain-containing protein [Geobacter sulfurreducens]QVW35074.1 zinc ribbon domain-containing protein [Geobacter sulfurreducens]UTG92580.1 zinc ribbon domain-containing protein [Geobacter sulfurreducens]
MPIYEYRCEDCGGTFSLLQKMGAGERETSCPACGSDRVRKLISAPAVGSSAGVAPAGGHACSIGGG